MFFGLLRGNMKKQKKKIERKISLDCDNRIVELQGNISRPVSEIIDW